MSEKKIKKILAKQLQLLSEYSKDCGEGELAEVSGQMLAISQYLISLEKSKYKMWVNK
ncbi:hypothetical protein MUDAN_DOGOELCO_02532 [Lactiplantibacillus mudanjiangensis]|uniref:hypothetical protein n=1 Tax=Lactiplantibacillus mudanjiangensis TaxID=1296538 RepID=UPI00101421CD|nr:hypothetical protein [Lactiplantibacillus mudanjiangensis]VDG33339.1 hypothetical protein MUDAN_DOGOELCO_02532 [Lactiplantibacillus mudanjiangensis]